MNPETNPERALTLVISARKIENASKIYTALDSSEIFAQIRSGEDANGTPIHRVYVSPEEKSLALLVIKGIKKEENVAYIGREMGYLEEKPGSFNIIIGIGMIVLSVSLLSYTADWNFPIYIFWTGGIMGGIFRIFRGLMHIFGDRIAERYK